MSRPRLIETGKFHRCRDRDLSRLRNITVVETETDRDWAKDVETETLSRVSLISGSTLFHLLRLLHLVYLVHEVIDLVYLVYVVHLIHLVHLDYLVHLVCIVVHLNHLLMHQVH